MEFVPKNTHWLLPEEPGPCDILLHYRGQYAVAIPSGQPVPFKVLERIAKEGCSNVYIRAQDQAAWNTWTGLRYPSPGQPPAARKDGKSEEDKQKQLYGNKRAELVSYLRKVAVKKAGNDKTLDTAFERAFEMLQKVMKLPSLDWYFQQFHEPPDLLQHNARVALYIAIFCNLRKVISDAEIETTIYSAFIHELEGDPSDNTKTVVSLQTLAALEKRKHPVPKEVIELIAMHDELCSGKGFPNNRKRGEIPIPARIFTLFNHFDHFRLRAAGTRRAKFEQIKETMTARQLDYDHALWPLFWDFQEKQVEAIL